MEEIIKDETVHILVVDDEPELCEIVLEILTRYYQELDVDISISITGNLEMAKKMLKKEHFPDLIITDLTLNGQETKGGLDLIRHAKETKPNLPWVLMTGHLFNGVTEEAEELGVSQILQKPFRINTLLNAVQNAFCLEN